MKKRSGVSATVALNEKRESFAVLMKSIYGNYMPRSGITSFTRMWTIYGLTVGEIDDRK
jgi:hypothetical protein